MNKNDKINQDFLTQYSSVFTEKLLKEAYDNKTHLSGKDILNLSSIKQLNLFVIKSFFTEWQEEVKKLESPLFDYKNREVRKSMIDFMNVLSQHISIQQSDLRPYVEKALFQSILLASDTFSYLTEDLSAQKASRVTTKFIKGQLKYLVLHKDLLLDFFTSVEGESVREALQKAELYFDDEDTSVTLDQLIEDLSKYLVVDRTDLFIPSFQPEPSVFEQTAEEENDEMTPEIEGEELSASSSDYFGQEIDTRDETSDTDVEETSEEELDSEDTLDKEEEQEVVDSLQTEATELPEEEESEPEEDEELSEETKDVEEEDPEQENTVMEKFEVDQKTLAELHEDQKIESVFEAISINHRYMFLQELFDGDNELFTTALKDVDACKTFDEAVEMLVQNYAKDFFWDMNSDEVKELLKVVYRKFRI